MNLWSRIDELVDGSMDLTGLQAHGLDLYAARRWRALGRTVPDDFLMHERAAAMATLATPALLTDIRGVLDGPILVMKGPEVAAYYPDPLLRPYCDLDLLVRDADTAHMRLLSEGWKEVPGASSHHLPTLWSPESMLLIEIHARPNWPTWTSASIDELFASAVNSALDIDGVQTLSRAHHAVLLAAHSWQHEPFRRLLDLIDVAVMSSDVDASILDTTARKWGLGPVWRETTRTINAILGNASTASVLNHLMTSHCRHLRERTVLESRLTCWIAGCWAPTAPAIVSALSARLYDDLRPFPGESWPRKFRRTGAVVQHALGPNSDCPRM